MEYAHIIDHLDSAIQAWKSEQTSQDAAPSSRASPQASRQDLLAAARGLVFALEAPKSVIAEVSKSVCRLLHIARSCQQLS